MSNRLAFLQQEAPAHYIAGLGRGATGFTTRSDIGPAQEGLDEEAIQAAIAAKAAAVGVVGDDDDPDRYEDAENEIGLFAGAPYDKDDEEADRTFDRIENMMMNRRNKGARYAAIGYVLSNSPRILTNLRDEEVRGDEEVVVDKNGMVLPPIRKQFTELKRQLSTVTDEEWANIPEVGDLTKRYKRQKQLQKEQRYYAVPDSVIAGAQSSTEFETSIEAGTSTGTTTDFVEMSRSRDKILGVRLDQASLKAGSSSSIDPKGYLTGLESQIVQTSTELADIKKARLLLRSVTDTDPKRADGWIAAARLEYEQGKDVEAQRLLAKGCKHCPKNKDVWLESARINTTENAKRILAEAVTHIPNSVDIWVQAMKLENENNTKRRVMRKALEMIPESVKLWKEAVELEADPNDAKLLLARATELIPSAIELWLALARIETYDNARQVLNKARKANRTSYEIWIAGARLEEQQGNSDRVRVLIDSAIQNLTKHGGMLSREQWIQEAEKSEEDGGVLTAQSIIPAILDLGLDDEEKKDTWMDDADGAIERSHPETARAIFLHALKVFPTKKSIWRKAAAFEKSLGNRENYFGVLEKSVVACPHDERLWLMYAKEKKDLADYEAAREILGRSFEYNPNSENIWLAAVTLETENNETERARQYLARATREAGTERICIRATTFERQNGQYEDALKLCDAGLAKFRGSDKLWLIKAQLLEESLKHIEAARKTYADALKLCKQSIPLWVGAAKLEETDGKVIKARSILDRARFVNKANDLLWYHSIQLELRDNKVAQAQNLISKALQECPASGLILSEEILQQPLTKRLPAATAAFGKYREDPYLMCTIGRIFWDQRKYDKAAKFFGNAIKSDPDNGDLWGWYYRFLVDTVPTLSTDAERDIRQTRIQETIQEARKADPKHGLLWPGINKRDENIKASMEDRLHQFAVRVRDGR